MSSNTCSGVMSSREGIENGGFYTPVGVRENENIELSGKLWEFMERELATLTTRASVAVLEVESETGSSAWDFLLLVVSSLPKLSFTQWQFN